jgi:predicted ATP-grasp superfamily ATP-dependent carboligase
MSVIILDGQLKSALTCVRSLGTAGIPVSAGAERDTAMSLHSKFAASSFVYPSPYTDRKGFIQRVKTEAVRLGDKPLVYAFSDATYLSLYEHREALKEHMTLVFPEEQSVEIAFDKAATYSLARVSGVPTIPTYTPETKEEVRELGERLGYPAVVKTRRSVTWKNGRGVFGSATFVHNKTELERTFFSLRNTHEESPLVQDMVYGEEYGVEMLAREGKAYARVTHHRMRSLSPTGGASVLKETLASGHLKSTLEAYAEMLVQKLTWSGPIMVEFKVDRDSQSPYLMEINGRFWGSLPLSVASGVDMPYLFYSNIQGENHMTGLVTGREGVVSRHFLGDVRHLMRVLSGRNPMRKHLYPKRTKALADFFSVPRGTKADVWSFKDPKPALMEIVDIIKKRISS